MDNTSPHKTENQCQACILRLDYIIKQMRQLKTAIYNNKSVLNFNEAHDYTGLSKSQLYKLTRQNGIPCHRPSGRLIFFNKQELDEWLCNNSDRYAGNDSENDCDVKEKES